MLQMRIVLCFLFVTILAILALAENPSNEQAVQQSLFDVDVQGHENTGERLARQFFGGGYGGRRGGGGRGYYGGGGRGYYGGGGGGRGYYGGGGGGRGYYGGGYNGGGGRRYRGRGGYFG